MHNWDILPFDIIYHDFTDLGIPPAVPQEQEVAALERRLHAARQHDDNRGRRVGSHGESFPEHEGCAEDERKVEDLGDELPRLHIGEAEHFRRFRERLDGTVRENGCVESFLTGMVERVGERKRREGGVAWREHQGFVTELRAVGSSSEARCCYRQNHGHVTRRFR